MTVSWYVVAKWTIKLSVTDCPNKSKASFTHCLKNVHIRNIKTNESPAVFCQYICAVLCVGWWSALSVKFVLLSLYFDEHTSGVRGRQDVWWEINIIIWKTIKNFPACFNNPTQICSHSPFVCVKLHLNERTWNIHEW